MTEEQIKLVKNLIQIRKAAAVMSSYTAMDSMAFLEMGGTEDILHKLGNPPAVVVRMVDGSPQVMALWPDEEEGGT